MMNNNLSCIPFYPSLEEQDFRKWYAYKEKYPFRIPSDYLVPFYFTIPKTDAEEVWTIEDVSFFRATCGETPITGTGSFDLSFDNSFDRGDSGAESLMSKMLANNLIIREIDSMTNEVVYFASHNIPLNLPKGIYYLRITLKCEGLELKKFYSDIFFVDARADLRSSTLHMEWWSEENIYYEGGRIPYGADYQGARYKSEMFVDAEVGRPSYPFTEEGEERDGYFFPIKQISEKVYNVVFYAPEYLCDAMRLIRMADAVRLTDRLGRIYYVEQFEMEVEWLEQGYYAGVSCDFHTDTVVKRVGRAYNNITDR